MRNTLLKARLSTPDTDSGLSDPAAWHADGSVADLPRWAIRYMSDDGAIRSNPTPCTEIIDRSHGAIRHRTVIVRDATSMDETTFTEQTHTAYNELLRGMECTRIFRIWNFIPRIGHRGPSGIDRYMRFNTARFESFKRTNLCQCAYPPASGVGHAGSDLVLHLLESDVSVLPLDNPRQVSPSKYSRTWGPLPPAFARGAVVEGLHASPLVIASGTASVRGEDTVFENDLNRQLDETHENLTWLLSEACGGKADGDQPRLDSALVYVTNAEHLDLVKTRVESDFVAPGSENEYRIGPLCRHELLVEIEGIHVLGAPDTRP